MQFYTFCVNSCDFSSSSLDFILTHYRILFIPLNMPHLLEVISIACFSRLLFLYHACNKVSKKSWHLKWKHLLVSVLCGSNVAVIVVIVRSPSTTFSISFHAVVLLLCNFVSLCALRVTLSKYRSTEEKQLKLYIIKCTVC